MKKEFKEILTAFLVIVCLITLMGVFLAASNRYMPMTITKVMPIATGTPALAVSSLLSNQEAIVSVQVNSSMTTVVHLVAWLDQPTPEVTPVVGTNAWRITIGAGIAAGTGIIDFYKSTQFPTGLGNSYYTSLTSVVLDSTQDNLKLCILPSSALDNEVSIIVDTVLK